MKYKAIIGLFLILILLVRSDTLKITPARTVASAHLFSLAGWEISNFHHKWMHLLWGKLSGERLSREERLELLDEYLVLARRVQKEQDRLEGPNLSIVGSTQNSIRSITEHLDELIKEKESRRAIAEETIEAELSKVLIEQGLGSRFGILIPPVDIRFDEPPKIFVVSPRDRIDLTDAVLLRPDITLLERDRLESMMLAEHNLSALVDNLAGLATYPTIVSDQATLRSVVQTAAHEWAHAYFFFRPLGRNLRNSEEMFTLNETVSDLVGVELGDILFAEIGGDLSISPSRYLSGEDRDPVLTQVMRDTRLKTVELLADGDIEEAEQYMKTRWWLLRLAGYRIRKLNQAYFAFRGRYAQGPASLSPIGDQVGELRAFLPSVGSFIKAIAVVSSYQDFLDKLESFRLLNKH